MRARRRSSRTQLSVQELEMRHLLDGQALFNVATTLPGTGQNHDVDLADLDGDGDLDAFITADFGEGNQVWFNNGQGHLTDSGQRLGTASNIYAALGDIDADGDVDAFVATRGGSRVWTNNGSGLFAPTSQVLGNAFSVDVALGDLDEDGDLDAFVANTNGSSDRIYLNNGTGLFSDSGQLLGTIHSKSVELGDLDGDGDLDAIVANGPNGGVGPDMIWLNDGNARFTDSGQRLGNALTQHVALGDLDDDGDLDAFAVGASPASVWINNSQGAMANTNQSLGASGVGSHVALADLDNDGDLDAWIANWSEQPDTVWLNNGSGQFVDSGLRQGTTISSHVALGDLNRDGNLDTIVANYGQANSVYFNLLQPRDINTETNSVFEQSPAGTPVGITAQAVFPGGGSAVYTLTEDADGRFAVDPVTGVVRVKDGTRLHALLNASHQIRITATSTSGATLSNPFSIAVTPHPLGRADVLASDGQFTDRVQLQWNAVTNAISYEVWRGTGETWADASYVLTTSATSAMDVTATPGVSYRYWVRPATATLTGIFGTPDQGLRGTARPTTAIASGATLVYDASTGALTFQTDTPVRFLRIESTSGLLGGTQFTTGEMNGATAWTVARLAPGLTQQFLISDLLVSGALPGDRSLTAIDLVYLSDPQVDAMFIYRQDTGEIAMDGKTGITAFEVKSALGIFTGPKPAVLNGLFDVYEPTKLFVLKPEGVEDLLFGPATQGGLDANTLIADVLIQGAKSPTGPITASVAHVSPMRVRLNTAPVAQNDQGFTTAANQLAAISSQQLLANDSDGDGDTLLVSQHDLESTQRARISRNQLGALVYNPISSEQLRALSANQSITDEFRYQISDGRGGADSATVFVQVTGVNDAPIAQDDATTILENQAATNLTALLLANDRDVDAGDELTILRVNTAATRGIVSLANGQLTYRPGSQFDYLRVDDTALDRFTYTVTDRLGATNTKTVTVTVVGESDLEGDLDGDGLINHADIHLLCSAIIQGGSTARFDLDRNGEISSADMDQLIRGILRTNYGDANLDGVFNTTDLVLIFQAGQYSDAIADNSTWAMGDWNCDREFDTSDLIVAFQAGGFVS